MKYVDVVQGSDEWFEARAGIPTASEFSKILTPRRAEPSSSQKPYMYDLIAERILGRPLEAYVSTWMKRGSAMEHEAAKFYEFQYDLELHSIGFVTNDAGTVGASPDRGVGPRGLLEVKCPAEHTHVAYLLGEPIDMAYRPQLQGQLWICEREWVDIFSFHPELPPARVRVERDEEYIGKLATAVLEFVDCLEEKYIEVLERLDGATDTASVRQAVRNPCSIGFGPTTGDAKANRYNDEVVPDRTLGRRRETNTARGAVQGKDGEGE